MSACRFLQRRLAAGLDLGRLQRPAFDTATDLSHARKRELRKIETHSDGRADVLEARQGRELRTQRNCETAIEPLPRIGRRLLAGAELALQLVKLPTHIDERLHGEL